MREDKNEIDSFRSHDFLSFSNIQQKVCSHGERGKQLSARTKTDLDSKAILLSISESGLRNIIFIVKEERRHNAGVRSLTHARLRQRVITIEI